MRKKNLKVIIAEAAEIAKTVPENLQEAAFHRVMDELLGKSLGSKIEAPEKKREATKPKRGFSHNPANLDGTLSILNDIDSTKYPEIQKMPKAIDKSLKVLQLARVDHETDGLTAKEITNILVNKFRIPSKENTIQKALARAADKVNRKNINGKDIFHIMAPGEAYLENLGQNNEGQTVSRPKAIKKAKTSKNNKGTAKKAKKEGVGSKKPSPGRPGPKEAIDNLTASGFFDSPKMIFEVSTELQQRRGYSYSVQVLSPALLRCVRNSTLKRDRNAGGQYEYSKA